MNVSGGADVLLFIRLFRPGPIDSSASESLLQSHREQNRLQAKENSPILHVATVTKYNSRELYFYNKPI